MRANLLLLFCSVCVAFLLVIVADALIGPPDGLVYPPGAVITQKTPEYEYTVHINTLGFRSPSTAFNPHPGKMRLMVLGDSFTYGWGVNYDATWPAIVADELGKRDLSVEVFNLGWAGRGPTEYANVAERAIPILKPQVVIVAILQGEDLAQVQQPPITSRPSIRILQRLFPNFWEFALRIRGVATSPDLKDTWQQRARRLAGELSQEELGRFEALDDDIKQLFYEGSLNPYLINLSVKMPDHFLPFAHLIDYRTTNGIDRLSVELARIKTAASEVDAEVLVTAVPYGVYVHSRYLNDNRRLGFRVDSMMLTSNAPEEAIAIAARRAGLAFIPTLASFREYAASRDDEALYYELDQHFTPDGNRRFAHALLAPLEDKYRSLVDEASGTTLE